MSHLSSGSGRKNNVSHKSSADIRSNEIKKASESLEETLKLKESSRIGLVTSKLNIQVKGKSQLSFNSIKI